MIEIIAEIGVNHNGSLQIAKELVDEAVAAEVFTIKTQLWNTERVYPRERWDEMKRLELSRDEIVDLKTYCGNLGAELIVTPDEIEDARFLKDADFKRIKTSSQDVTNLEFLRKIGELGLPVICSLGACNWHEVSAAKGMLKSTGILQEHQITLMHCVSAYPAPFDQMNLLCIRLLQQIYPGCFHGFSDHCMEMESAIMALALGATMFEKHMTLDNRAEGPDHATSLEPAEFYTYAQTLKMCQAALGTGDKMVMPCEVENRSRYDSFIAQRAAKC